MTECERQGNSVLEGPFDQQLTPGVSEDAIFRERQITKYSFREGGLFSTDPNLDECIGDFATALDT